MKSRIAVHFAAVLAAAVLAVVPAVTSGALSHPTDFSSRATLARASKVSLCERRGGHYIYLSRVNRLSVVRSRPLNKETFIFASVVHSARVGAIRDLARAFCNLPPVTSAAMSCPADFGVDYTLTFAVKGGGPSSGVALAPVVVDATGCTTVTGLVHVRWTIGRPHFFAVFGAAIGLAHASRDTFAGTLAS